APQGFRSLPARVQHEPEPRREVPVSWERVGLPRKSRIPWERQAGRREFENRAGLAGIEFRRIELGRIVIELVLRNKGIPADSKIQLESLAHLPIVLRI